MKTPKEIQEICARWWKDFLVSIIDGVAFFPKEISNIGKVSSKDILQNLPTYISGIELLERQSKAERKYGYTVVSEYREFNKIGRQSVPEKVVIETQYDYLKFIDKEKEYRVFVKNYNQLQQQIPELKEWAKENPTKLIEHRSWSETIKVCQYFIKNPQPRLYIRQLPIDIHTKYIGENEGLIQSLLIFLLPEELINKEERRFEKRFHLKYAEPNIRIRFLDAALSPIPNVTDIALPLSEASDLKFACANVFVTENLMNFLTLPRLKNTIAIWSGGGFNVSHLRDIQNLSNKQFYYWGDLDAHGFQILNQFRAYFPNTISVLMEEQTLADFAAKEGQPTGQQTLQYLLPEELKLYNYLRSNNLRLEQEQISQIYAEKKIFELFV